jgi:hypothetical protein
METNMLKDSKKRSSVSLDAALESQLQGYTAAATGASCGVVTMVAGLLAFSQSADAKVVYTPTHQILEGPSNHYTVDLNNDGIADVSIAVSTSYFQVSATTARFGRMYAGGLQPGNEVVVNTKKQAAAGRIGQQAGPPDPFASRALMGSYFFRSTETSHQTIQKGPWRNVSNRYLGVKLSINGETHYGWLRISVDRSVTEGLLTGYAYETIPNKPIKAGLQKSGVSMVQPNPAGRPGQRGPRVIRVVPSSLGALATGVIRRNPKSENANIEEIK